jgi:hypothetical protein
MDISSVEQLFKKYNVPEESIAELRAAAAALPSGLIDDSAGTPTKIAGLDGLESELLALYMLEEMAPQFGVVVEATGLWALAGFPDKRQLLKKVDRRQPASISHFATAFSHAAASDRRHERV